MDRLQFSDAEIPLLEPPHKVNEIPRRILYVLFKHKLLIAAIFLLVSFPIITIVLLRPREYVATSKVMVKPSRASLSLSPGETAMTQFSVYPSPEFINSEIQIIRGRELREQLYKEVAFSKEDKSNARGMTRGPLQVTPVRLSNLIQISQTSSDPEWAVRIVNRAVELYLEQHLKVHKIPGIEAFYDEQEKRLQLELTQAEKELKEYQEKEKIVDAGQELTSRLAALTSFETTLRNTESSIRESNEKIRILETQLKEQQPASSASKHVSINPLYDRIRDKLIQLELEKDSLLQRYTPNDRLVRDKEKEIADLNNRLANILSDSKAVWSTNPVHQGILNALLKERADLTALEARRNSLLKQVASYSSAAAELKRKSFTYDRLQQNVSIRKDALALYKRRGEEARISNAMDEQKFTNVTIFEKARLPLPRAGWSPWMVVLGTLLASLAIAVVGAFVVEFFNTALRNEADVEEQIGLPVLATIQYLKP